MQREEIGPQKIVSVPESIDDLICVAKLAEAAERDDDMVLCMRKVVQRNSDLSTEARHLLSVAYKNVVGTRRASWRLIASIEERGAARSDLRGTMELTAMLRQRIEVELREICSDLLNLLDAYLIPAAQAHEPKVLYLKMKGDNHRYCAEAVPTGEEGQLAHEAYAAAVEVARSSLAPTHPTRLGLALNFSVFLYETVNEHDKGFNLARQAYDEAVAQLETLGEDDYRASTPIVQMLRDNLSDWSEQQQKRAADRIQELEETVSDASKQRQGAGCCCR